MSASATASMARAAVGLARTSALAASDFTAPQAASCTLYTVGCARMAITTVSSPPAATTRTWHRRDEQGGLARREGRGARRQGTGGGAAGAVLDEAREPVRGGGAVS